MNTPQFNCSQCQKELGEAYAVLVDGGRLCYVCASNVERAEMIERGRGVLYLTRRGNGYQVGNWSGVMQFPARNVSIGRHNIARTQTRFRFTGPDGVEWWGVQYGDNSEIARVRRCR